MGGAPIQLANTAGETVPLQGTWRFSIEKGIQPDANLRQPDMPMGPGNPWVPTSLYNGMIAQLPPFAIRGALWYQGESNSAEYGVYALELPALIKDWRNHWGQGDFPFIVVQLPNFAKPRT